MPEFHTCVHLRWADCYTGETAQRNTKAAPAVPAMWQQLSHSPREAGSSRGGGHVTPASWPQWLSPSQTVGARRQRGLWLHSFRYGGTHNSDPSPRAVALQRRQPQTQQGQPCPRSSAPAAGPVAWALLDTAEAVTIPVSQVATPAIHRSNTPVRSMGNTYDRCKVTSLKHNQRQLRLRKTKGLCYSTTHWQTKERTLASNLLNP